MNERLAAQQDASFDRAQAQYDAQEPPEFPECRICNGTGKVEVASFLDVDGIEMPWPRAINAPEVACPSCMDRRGEWRR